MSDLGHDDLRNLIQATQARDAARAGAPPPQQDEAARLRAEIARLVSAGAQPTQGAPPAYDAVAGGHAQQYQPPTAAGGYYQAPPSNHYTASPGPASVPPQYSQPGAAGAAAGYAQVPPPSFMASAAPSDEAARLREEIARLKQKEANPPYGAPPAPSPQDAEMVALHAELERMRTAERAREEAALRAEIERARHTPAIAIATVDPELARLRAEVERMRNGAAASIPPTMTPDQIERERLRRELEELRNASAALAQPPVDSETLRLRAEVEEMKRLLAAQQKPEPPVAAATASATPAPYVMDPEVAALTKMLHDLQNGHKPKETARQTDVPQTTNSAQLARLAEEEKRMKAETERMQAQLQETLRRQRMEMEAIRNKTSAAPAVTQAQMTAVMQTYQKKVKGVDIAVLMDCTGSMSPWIAACVQKIGDIMAQSTTLNVSINIAFIGYRDHCDGSDHFVTSGTEFIPYERVGDLQAVLQSIRAKGGCGEFADVAGALNRAKQLKWVSSTKLIMHFGDTPPHGTQYQNSAVSSGDPYPRGDPNGLVPEDIMRHFCANGIDFYCIEIARASTQKATKMFFDAFGNNRDGPASGKGQFYVMTLGDDVNQFMPTFIKSIQTSMSNRRMVEKNAASLT